MEEIKPVLYLNMIVKEDEPLEIVKRSIDSVKNYVDGIYVTITYTEKEPVESALKKLLDNEYKANVSFFKWTDNFSEARNYALEQLPKGDEIYMYWQDADDVLGGAKDLRNVWNDMIKLKQSAVYFPYWYMVELDEEGSVKEVLITHKRERIIQNNGVWKWVGDLHETLIEQRTENVIRVGREECTVIHLSTDDRINTGLDRNIRILQKQAQKENHKDPRTLIYLAKAYVDKGKASDKENKKINFDLALNLFHEYLAGSGKIGDSDYQTPSGWREERGTAWSHIGEIAILSNHPEVAAKAYQSAIDEAYEFPEYYVNLAMCYCMMGDYKRAKHWLNVAAATPMPNTTIVVFPRDLRLKAMQCSLEISMHEQNLKQAKQDAEEILKITPNDPNAKHNLDVVTSITRFNEACQSVVCLGKYLESQQDTEKLAHLVQSIPADMQQEKFAAEMRHAFMPIKIWGENEITILCGPSFEKWSPKSVDTGIGGSEEAVIQLSKELTKKGWKVTVYADPREDAGNYEGVEYKQWYDINWKDNFNVLILWRSIGFIDTNPKAKFTMLWLHDIPSNPEFTKERIDKIDKIAVLSEYHKSLLRMHDGNSYKPMPENKVFLTSNGITPVEFKWKGNPHRIIYMSSPDRGLVYLLKNWEKIKKEVEDAELHIFYGFKVFDAIHRNNPAMQQWKEKVMNMMKQPGVVFHDRVGHNALHYEISRSGLWAYPTDFEEISCISGMKAQAYGAIPVVTNFAALEETVKNGAKVEVDIQTEEGQKDYTDALITALKNVDWQKDTRKDMVPWAKDYFAWSNVASLWDSMLRSNVQNPEKRMEIENDKNDRII